jgi:phosphoribosylformylglycinamidine synthase
VAVLVWPGPAALPDFRRRALAAALAARHPGVRGVDARYAYFIATDGPLPEAVAATLRAILDEGPVAADGPGAAVWVTPRPGTISPWSSKATDIVHNAGLATAIRRVERGIRYAIEVDGGLDAAALAALAPELHDRMTEWLGREPPAPVALFGAADPRPLPTPRWASRCRLTRSTTSWPATASLVATPPTPSS